MSEVDAFADGDDVSVVKPKRGRRPKQATPVAPKVVTEQPVRPELRGGVPNPADPNLKRVRIILNDSPNIPRGGQFFCVNGYTALIKPGKEVKVPEAVVDVLNNAIEYIPVKDENTLQVIGQRAALRFPYTNLGPA